MLMYIESKIPFAFNPKHVHHIEQQGATTNMLLILDDGTHRVLSREEYTNLIKYLGQEQQVIYI